MKKQSPPLQNPNQNSLCADGENELLRATQQQFEALFAHMVEGVCVRDRMGRVVLFNRAVADLFEVSEAEFWSVSPGDPKFQAKLEDGSDLGPENVASAIAIRTGQVVRDQVLSIKRRDGSLRWISVTAVPIFRSGESEPLQSITTFRDISSERQVRLELEDHKLRLKRREEFLETTLGAMPSLVSYITPDFIYRYMNKAYSDWFGAPVATLIGRSVPDVLGPESFRRVRGFLEKSLAGEEVRVEHVMPRPLGGQRLVRAVFAPQRIESGEVEGVYVFIDDITEARKAKISLEQSENRVSKILDSLPGAIGYWDRECRNINANLEYAGLFGFEPERMKGKHLSEFIGQELFEKNRPFIEDALRGRSSTFERDHLQEGVTRVFLVRYMPDFDNGQVVGFFVLADDITHLRDMEEERRAMEAKLIAASKMSALGEMAGGIAHEINNPLAIITGRASLLKTALEGPEVNRDKAAKELTKIEATVERIAKIIRGLRAFARNADADEPVPTSLGTILTDTLELSQERIKNHNIELLIHISDEHRMLEVRCRAPQISQILMNLLGNAIDAVESLSEKWIRVTVEVRENIARIEVMDSGSGIPEKVVEKMMNPFFTTKEVGKGTGLGLSISRGLAVRNGGNLSYCPDRPNTAFVLELPIAEGAKEKETSSGDVKAA